MPVMGLKAPVTEPYTVNRGEGRLDGNGKHQPHLSESFDSLPRAGIVTGWSPAGTPSIDPRARGSQHRFMIRVLPSRDGFAEFSRGLSVVAVYCSILSDQLTPVSAFERVAPEVEHAFPLESVVGGEKIARYSFLGAGPFFLVEAERETVSG